MGIGFHLFLHSFVHIKIDYVLAKFENYIDDCIVWNADYFVLDWILDDMELISFGN